MPLCVTLVTHLYSSDDKPIVFARLCLFVNEVVHILIDVLRIALGSIELWDLPGESAKLCREIYREFHSHDFSEHRGETIQGWPQKSLDLPYVPERDIGIPLRVSAYK